MSYVNKNKGGRGERRVRLQKNNEKNLKMLVSKRKMKGKCSGANLS